MSEAGLELEITELRLGLPGAGGGSGSGGCFGVMTAEWPPVCSYRRRCEKGCTRMVKISMDGVPFLRKIDVIDYHDYLGLIVAIENLFGCFGIGDALRDAQSCEYVLIYEDKDGDWLLIGDVPWKMFVESCKRLRIMKRPHDNGFEVQTKKLFQE